MTVSLIPENHYLYVIEFSDGVVKVGRTKRVRSRVRQHRAAARVRGAVPTRGWHSEGHSATDVARAELSLIKLCALRWPIAWGAEYFRADYVDVIELAAELDQALFLLEGRFDELTCDIFAA